jgi:hypothetical protein
MLVLCLKTIIRLNGTNYLSKNMLQRLNVKILLLNPWIWWLIFTVIFLSQITIVYADDYLPIVSDSPGPLYDERDYIQLYTDNKESSKSLTDQGSNVERIIYVQSEFTDKSYETYKTSMDILLEISLSSEFENYQKPIQDLITRALLGISLPPTWDNESYEVTCRKFVELITTYNNDRVLKHLYWEYLLSNSYTLGLSPEELTEYYKTELFKTLAEDTLKQLNDLFPSKE